MNNDDVAILPLVVLLATHMFTPRYTKLVEGQSQCTPKWMIFWKFSKGSFFSQLNEKIMLQRGVKVASIHGFVANCWPT